MTKPKILSTAHKYNWAKLKGMPDGESSCTLIEYWRNKDINFKAARIYLLLLFLLLQHDMQIK